MEEWEPLTTGVSELTGVSSELMGVSSELSGVSSELAGVSSELPSMREAVSTGNHRMAAAVEKLANALCDARGGHNPTVAAATTQRSQSPVSANGEKSDKRSGNARSKSHPPSCPDFYSFHNPGNGVCKFHNFYIHKALKCISPCT